ncbi:MAG TPA: hypothetical protein VKV95_17940 [Terriglobia bacterium]|nr:hypothetical protein [Terriglobia bacterium]
MKNMRLAKTKWSVFPRVASTLAASAMLGALAALPAGAQTLGLAPAQVQYRFEPGQPFQFDLSVSNNSKTPASLSVSVTDFWYNEKNEKVFGAPGSSPRSAANWIEVVPRHVAVPAEGTAKVQVIVTPPRQVSGGYYAVIFVESKPELTEAATAEKRAVYTNMRLGSLILLSAANTEKYQVGVSDAQFAPPLASQTMKLDFLLANESNTHIFPLATAAIVNSRHELIAKAEGDKKRFLPGQKDRVPVSWTGTLPPGNYSAILTVMYGEDKNYTQEFPFTIAGGQ